MEKIPEVNMENEETDEEVFRAYMDDVQLSPEDFDKKILDVGSGMGQFAKWAKEHNISSEIYSLEPKQISEENEKSVRGFAEAIPFHNGEFDLVISNASIPNVFLGEKKEVLKWKIQASLSELMRVTKPGGEIRLGRVLKGTEYDSQRELTLATEDELKELEKTQGVNVEEIPYPSADLYEYEDHEKTKLIARAYLIKIHKL